MDELDVVRELRSDLPPADPAILAGARAELLRQARGATRPRTAPRLRWALVGTGGIAAIVAGVLIVGALRGPTQDNQAVVTPSSAGTSTTLPAHTAASILRNAAVAAGKGPNMTIRPNQFLYIESITAYTSTAAILGPDGTLTPTGTTLVKQRRQVWLSVDGTHDGLLRTGPLTGSGGIEETRLYGCRNGQAGPVITSDPCVPRPAVRTDLPIDPDAMLAWLYANSHGGKPRDVQAFVTVGDLIKGSYLAPASLSALFSAASRLPGTTVDPDAADVSGRPGIAVKMPSVDHALVFDPQTYEYLGERGEYEGQPTGSARLRMAIVDRAGQLP